MCESWYGNTKKVAQAETVASKPENNIFLRKTAETSGEDTRGINLYVVGSPNYVWNTTRHTCTFIGLLKMKTPSGIKATALDTAFRSRFSRSAVKKVLTLLKKKGCTVLNPYDSFILKCNEGPLEQGGRESEATWTEKLRKNLKHG